MSAQAGRDEMFAEPSSSAQVKAGGAKDINGEFSEEYDESILYEASSQAAKKAPKASAAKASAKGAKKDNKLPGIKQPMKKETLLPKEGESESDLDIWEKVLSEEGESESDLDIWEKVGYCKEVFGRSRR